jgi:hypothetical protein
MNWELLIETKPQISQSVITTKCELGKLTTAWRTKNGNYADGTDNNADILKVKTDRFPEKIETELSEGRSATTIPNNFYLPVYKIKGSHLILDGNHRAVALYRSGVVPNICMLSIEGPICSKILPDLAKWE